jgi:hypothetical protein
VELELAYKRDLAVKSNMFKSSLTKSETSLSSRDYYELEVNIEYDAIRKHDTRFGLEGDAKFAKKDLFSAIVKLPKAYAR